MQSAQQTKALKAIGSFRGLGGDWVLLLLTEWLGYNDGSIVFAGFLRKIAGRGFHGWICALVCRSGFVVGVSALPPTLVVGHYPLPNPHSG
ncbi:MAG: hypothetical protein H8E35_01325 [Ardenticatenia bacterium]|nr:hypothetical protein [Ardenticatenia bacterium]